MQMQILKQLPPNIAEITKKFDLSGLHPVFTYGNTLYNPTGGHISDDLMAHEETHSRQQAVMGVENWWALYLKSAEFRLQQETEAYRVQYQAVKSWNRDARREFLNDISKNLASKLYGNIVNKKQAKDLINV